MIIMERRGHFGLGPAYNLTIEGNGNVIYEGGIHVEAEGIRKAWINSQKTQTLVTAIKDANFFSLEDHYAIGATDLDSVTLSITLDGESKSIWHYGVWCSDEPGKAPLDLCELENLIDEITNTDQWVGNVVFFGVEMNPGR